MNQRGLTCLLFISLPFIYFSDYTCADTLNVRLTLTSQTNHGRVEVQRVADDGRQGIWGTVCDNGFSNREAQVVCRQLGYRYGKAENGVYRDYNSMFVLDEITCLGNETILGQCSHSPWLEHHCVSFENFYAGVCCSNESSFGEHANDSFISHCQKTRFDAREACEDINKDVVDVPFYNLTEETTTYWSSKVYTPWIGQLGCFKIPGLLRHSIKLTTLNGPGTCAQLCLKNINFGLSGEYCYCLNELPTQKHERNRCYLTCRDDNTQSCGDGVAYMSVYEIVPDDDFLQHTDPSAQKQCVVLEHIPVTGNRILKSAECEAKHICICEYGKSQFVIPGGNLVDFETARELCHNHSMSLAGIKAVDAEYLYLNSPSWIDISRYTVGSVLTNNDTVFQPKWCVVTSVKSNGGKHTQVVDCQTRHIFVCGKRRDTHSPYDSDDTHIDRNNTSIPQSVVDDVVQSSFTSTVSTTTLYGNSMDTITVPFLYDKQLITLVVIISSSSVVLLVLCTASICICMRRRRKQTATQHVYSGAHQNNTESELLSYRTDKADQPYTSAYDTIRDSNAYSEITENDRDDGGIHVMTQLERESDSGNCANYPPTPDDDLFAQLRNEPVELGENYTEPGDAITTRKPKLKNVKSSHSYTYPYDSLDRLTDHRKTKSTT